MSILLSRSRFMRLAIMQPYFMPYLGYFSLIDATDQFVVFDEVQYIRHGWINRNRILKPGFQETQFVGYPVAKHSRATQIRRMKIAVGQDWKARMLAQVEHYRKEAPFFDDAVRLLKRCLKVQTNSVVEFNVECLRVVCGELGLPFNFRFSNDVVFDRYQINHPGQWALRISKAMNGSTYINPIGGRDLFTDIPFEEFGIEFRLLENRLSAYPQAGESFHSGLSILDVIMFNGPQRTRQLVKEYKIFEADQFIEPESESNQTVGTSQS